MSSGVRVGVVVVECAGARSRCLIERSVRAAELRTRSADVSVIA